MVKEKISIIIPAYNEEETIEITSKTINEVLQKENIIFDIIFVDDGSSDNTWNIIKKVSQKNSSVSGLKFSKNFGKESAILAGINSCTGDACIVMDCDLQHPVETIIDMYKIWKNNDVQIIEARKKQRQKESFSYRIFAKTFYKIMKALSGLDLKNLSDFKLLDRQVIEVIKNMTERETFFRAISEWTGFNKEYIYYDVSERVAGKTKWSFISLVKLSINSITSYSSLPMQLVSFFGLIFLIFAIGLSIQSLLMKIYGNAVEGFTTVIILLLIIGSIIMFSLGVIGVYIAKIYNEVKFRPRYIISDKTNTKEDIL